MTKAEIAPLTGLRFVAALSILCLHTMQWCTPFSDTRFFNLSARFAGIYGMPLFFVLSGFVIHYNYAILFRKLPYGGALREFFGARIARLYPLYFIFLVAGVLSDSMVNWIPTFGPALLSYLVHSVTLTQSWVYKLAVNQRLLLDNGFGLGWSVSTEFFFYLAYAIAVFAIWRLRRPGGAVAATVVFAAVMLAVDAVVWTHLDSVLAFFHDHWSNYLSPQENRESSFARWFFYYSPYARVWEFLLGCLTAQTYLLVRDRPVGNVERRFAPLLLYSALAISLAYAIVWILRLGPPSLTAALQFFKENFGLAPPIAAIIFCVARYRSAVATMLSLPWIVWLGEISYSIYAVHTWTLRPFIRPPTNLSVATATDAVFRIAFALAFTIIVASATYRIIEVPARRYLRTKLMRPTPLEHAPPGLGDEVPHDAPVVRGGHGR